MNEQVPRSDTHDGGHRAVKKPASRRKLIKANANGVDGKAAPEAARGSSGGSAARKSGAALSRLSGPLKRAGNAIWRVWDRGYDAAAARPVHAVKVFGVVVAAVALLGGLTWLANEHYVGLNETRAQAAQDGEAAVAQLLSYNWRSLDRQVAKTQDLVTGKFKDDYAQFVNTTIAPTARDKQVSSQTSVDRSAIVSASSNEVVMLMYLDQESGSQLNPSSDSSFSSVRVTLRIEDGKWKVSEITPV